MHTEHTTDSSEHLAPAAASVSQLAITGMTCSNCARHVSEAIQRVPGVRSATVSLESQQAAVRWIPGSAPDVSTVIRAVEAEGYGAKPFDARVHEHGRGEISFAGWQINLWIGVLGTVPLMIGEWMFGLGLTPWFRWISLVLAGTVQVAAGARFYRGAWNQLKVGSSNMDTLVALGSTTAFAYSVWALFCAPDSHLYFMEAAAIITLISVGHWLESRVSARASSALRQLLRLAPQTARRLTSTGPAPEVDILRAAFKPGRVGTPAGQETEVPVAELKIGDLVALRPGDHVPTDGRVVEGDSAVDESMLTGESAPVDKTVNSPVHAGTVNLNGRLVVRVTATGDATALAHIIAAVQRAQSSRANLQRLGDRVSSVFVPVVVVIAILAGLWWGLAPDSARHIHDALAPFLWTAHTPTTALAAAFIIASAVLIVACPCAMGLATPAAIMASSNAAARRGILIRDGVALEKAGRITAVLFDKTGTLTSGKPSLVKVWAAKDGSNLLPAPVPATSGTEPTATDPTPALFLAAALARHSTHPVSQAIASAAAGTTEISDWQEVRGAGVQGRISNLKSQISDPPVARLGSLKWLRETGVDLAPGEAFVTEWSVRGASLVGLAVGRALLGLFAVNDAVKPGAARVVGELHRQGLKTWLITGDHALTAAGVAKQTGIAPENVLAEIRPEQKAEWVKRLQQRGERVAFVGDGINDAPALEQADLGIAVSRATDIAREAADIILLNSELEAVAESLGLARATLRTIKQNLFWAFFYNSVGVPLAVLGYMSPVLCAAAMGFSDLIVIGNALRLNRWGRG
jgi:Cu+-exporting ATPase